MTAIGENVMEVLWDDMKAQLEAFANALDQKHQISAKGGAVEPYLDLGKFTIGVIIQATLPKWILDIAKDEGIGVAKDKSGILFTVTGYEFPQMVEKLRSMYVRWANAALNRKQQLIEKVEKIKQ
jgi:hypothetical protein